MKAAPLYLVLLGLTGLLSLGCSNSKDLTQNLAFNFKPDFASYTGGIGIPTSPLAGAWHLHLNASSNGIMPSTTYDLIPQAVLEGHSIGFLTTPNGGFRTSTYLEAFLDGTNLIVKLHEYAPLSNKVTETSLNGSLNLAAGTVSDGIYQTDITGIGDQSASGSWSLEIAPIVPPEFLPIGDASLTNLRVELADKDGQGDMELFASLNLPATPTPTLTNSTMTVSVVNDQGNPVTSTNLTVQASRTAEGVLGLTFSGTLGSATVDGTGIITAADIGSSTRFSGGQMVSGIVRLHTSHGTGVLNDRDFAGTIGR